MKNIIFLFCVYLSLQSGYCQYSNPFVSSNINFNDTARAINSPSSKLQNFAQLPNVELKGAHLGFLSWCDYNSDGFLDIIITGVDYGHPFEHVDFYKNNGDNTFTLADIDNVPRVIYGDMAWGDIDNNGEPDLIIAGTTSGSSEENQTLIFKNNGNEGFEELAHTVPNLARCDLEWVDIDNDGWQDIYYHGINSENEFDLGIFKNLQNGQFEEVEINIEKITGPRGNFTVNQVVWADFDNDGLKDVTISMSTQLEFDFVFYKNLGEFNFELIDIGLPQLNYVRQRAGDINQDGLMDLVFMGSPQLSLSSSDWSADVYVFVNNGNLIFTEESKIDNIGVFINTLDLGDFNNDGYLDLMTYGTGSGQKELRLFVNNHDNTFSNYSQSFPDAQIGGAWFADFDNDNDLDFVYSGRFTYPNDYEATYFYENQNTLMNQSPLPPDSMIIFARNNNLIINWPDGSDDLTPDSSLYYNFQMGTAGNPNALISPFAHSEKLKVINMGNQNLGNYYYYRNLAEGNFQISLQSIDHAYNASVFSEPFEFCFKHTQSLFPDTITACVGDTVNLEIDGNYLGYLWNTGETTPSIDVFVQGIYNVNLTHADGCLSSEVTYVKFNSKPEVDLGSDKNMYINDTLVLYIDNMDYPYLWSDGSTADSLIVFGNEQGEGVHDFWVEVTNEYYCKNFDTISINVIDNSNVGERFNNLRFAISPNPAKNKVQIVLSHVYDQKLNVTILDLSGRAVISEYLQFISKTAYVDVSRLLPGMYLLKVEVGKNEQIQKLLIR